VSGAVTITDDPRDSTLHLLICSRGAARTDAVTVHAALTSANPDGAWRFTGSVASTVSAPISVDVTYHGSTSGPTGRSPG